MILPPQSKAFRLRLLTLLPAIALGCATVRPEVTPDIKTIAAVGDRPYPVVTGPPGAAVVTDRPPPDRQVVSEGTISGRVVDARGKPVSQARVRLAADGVGRGRVASVNTDDAGGFTLRGLRPGSTYTVIAEWEDDAGLIASRVRAQAPDDEVRIELVEEESVDAPTYAGTRKPIDRVSNRQSPSQSPSREPTLRVNAADVDDPPAPAAESLDTPLEESDRSPMPASPANSRSRVPGLWRPSAGAAIEAGRAATEFEPISPAENLRRQDRLARNPSEEVLIEDEGPNPLPPAREPTSPRAGPLPEIPVPTTPQPRTKPASGVAYASPAPQRAAPVIDPNFQAPPVTVTPPPVERPRTVAPPVDLEPNPEPAPTPRPVPTPPAEPTPPVIEIPEAAPPPSTPSPIETPETAPAAPAAETHQTAPPSPAPTSLPQPEPAAPVLPPLDAEREPDPAPEPPPSPTEAPVNSEQNPVQDRAETDPPELYSAPGVPEAIPSPESPELEPSRVRDEVQTTSAESTAQQAPARRLKWGELASQPPLTDKPARRASAYPTLALLNRTQPSTRRTAVEEPDVNEAPPPPDTTCEFDTKSNRLVDFRLKDLQGKDVRFQDLDADLILLDFWGTWCAPCRDAIPHLVELQKTYGAQRLKVVGVAYEQVAVDKQAALVVETARKLGVNYQLLLGKTDVPCPLRDALHVQVYPTMVLLDRHGRVLWRQEGATTASLSRLDRTIATALQPAERWDKVRR